MIDENTCSRLRWAVPCPESFSTFHDCMLSKDHTDACRCIYCGNTFEHPEQAAAQKVPENPVYAPSQQSPFEWVPTTTGLPGSTFTLFDGSNGVQVGGYTAKWRDGSYTWGFEIQITAENGGMKPNEAEARTAAEQAVRGFLEELVACLRK